MEKYFIKFIFVIFYTRKKYTKVTTPYQIVEKQF